MLECMVCVFICSLLLFVFFIYVVAICSLGISVLVSIALLPNMKEAGNTFL